MKCQYQEPSRLLRAETVGSWRVRLEVTVPSPMGKGPAGLGTSCQGLRSETVRTQLCRKFHNPCAQAPTELCLGRGSGDRLKLAALGMLNDGLQATSLLWASVSPRVEELPGGPVSVSKGVKAGT